MQHWEAQKQELKEYLHEAIKEDDGQENSPGKNTRRVKDDIPDSDMQYLPGILVYI